MYAEALPVKQQDVSPQQLQKQNIQIAKYVAIELSKDLPKTIDKYTKFIDIKAKNTNLIYTFEINTGSKSDEAVKKDDYKRMKRSVINGVCRSSKRFMEAQIGITYIYKSAVSKQKLFHFDIDQSKCNNL
jgi:histidine ammonia-lyase